MSRADELADECIRQFEEGTYERSLFRQSGEELRRLSAVNAELLGALKKARAALQGALGMKLIDGTYADKDCSITMAIITSDAAIQKAEEA